MFNAAECARKAGKFGFGLDESKTAQALRKLAEEIETGKVALHSVSTAIHVAQDDFTVREVVIEVLEESASAGPRVVKN